jgi:hypothetical protein
MTSVRFLEEGESDSDSMIGERMKHEKESVGDRTIRHERSARLSAVISHAHCPASFSDRRDSRLSSEVSIAGKVGAGLTAAVWFLDSAARSESNQSSEPTRPAVRFSERVLRTSARGYLGLAAHL